MNWLTTKFLGWALVVAVLAGVAGVGVQQLRIAELRYQVAKAERSAADERTAKKEAEKTLEQERGVWQKERAERSMAFVRGLEAAWEKERSLQEAATKFRNNAYAQIDRLARARDAALSELQQRPERPAAGPAAPGSGPLPAPDGAAAGCTGAGLFRPDAQFLVWFAAEASRVAIERDTCYQQHESDRQ